MSNRKSIWNRFAIVTAVGAAALAVGCDNRDDVPDVTHDGDATPAAAVVPGEGASVAAASTAADGRRQFALAYPTGERATSALLLEKVAPAKAKVGQPFEYDIRVTNLTDAPLAGVTVVESLGEGVAFESSQPATRPAGGGGASAGGAATWNIGELAPNETKTIHVSAIASQQGKLSACLAATYQPTLCTLVEAVNPQLMLTKAGPQQAYLCDPLTFTYTVRNTGSGVAEDVVVRETLPDGLTTADGNSEIEIQVGDLPAGQSKEIELELKPARPGEFASHATAKSASDEARSAEITTQVVEPKLAVDVRGPEWHYPGQPVTYTVNVTNQGDATARAAVLKLDAPKMADDARTRALGNIEPGQTRTLQVTVDGGATADTKLVATANSTCAPAVSDTAVAAVRRIPALLIETVDNTDPVRIGQSTVYTIMVKNQGSAPARNVAVTAQLPGELSFVEASGQTDVQASGQKLTFAPVGELAAGDVAAWYVEAKANKAGDTRMRVEVDSDYLDQPVPEIEPTRVY